MILLSRPQLPARLALPLCDVSVAHDAQCSELYDSDCLFVLIKATWKMPDNSSSI